MTRTKLFAAATAGIATLGLLGGGLAIAKSSDKDGGERVEAQMLLDAGQSLGQVIAAAEAKAGGKAVSAEFEYEDGAALFEVKTVAGDVVMEFEIDPATGKILKSEKEGFISKMVNDDDDYAGGAIMKTSLAEAIGIAERSAGGKAMEAEFEAAEDGDAAEIEVEIVKPDLSVLKVSVNPDTGAVMATIAGDADEDEDEDDDDKVLVVT